MTLLGYRNPLRRLAFAVRGWADAPDPQGGAREIWVVGHRGAARFAMENTIPSYRKALELGADAIEADICVTRDRRFVVWHDADPNEKGALARQAGWEGLLYCPAVPDVGSPWRKPVAELDLSELRAHYGYTRNERGPWDALAGGEPEEGGIPTLEELTDWAAGEPRLRHVLLDIKLVDGQEEEALELLATVRALVESGAFRKDLSYHFLVPHRSVARALLTEARSASLSSTIALHADFEFPGSLKIARRIGARDVSMGCRRSVWAGFLRELGDVVKARDEGAIRSVVAWTVSDEKPLRELVGLQPDGILTDDSRLLRQIVMERKW